jgi:hypothetical protein
MKNLDIGMNDFYRFFRTKVRDSVLSNLFGSNEDAMKYLEEELPKWLWRVIPLLESNSKSPGWMKFGDLIEKLYYQLRKHKLLFLQPFLAQLLEYSVVIMYNKYFFEKAREFGFHDEFETIIGLDLDSSGEIGDEPEEEVSEENEEIETPDDYLSTPEEPETEKDYGEPSEDAHTESDV